MEPGSYQAPLLWNPFPASVQVKDGLVLHLSIALSEHVATAARPARPPEAGWLLLDAEPSP